MSEYVYYNGKIYTKITNVYNQTLYCHKNDIYHFFDVKDICGDYVEFDNPEDLIKAGDLVAIHTPSLFGYELMFVKDLHLDKTLFTNNKSYSNKNIDYKEIWKRINNTFVRICHKEINGEWVID